MNLQYYVKAIWAGAIAFLGPIGVLLLATPKLGLVDLSAGVWISSAVLGLVAFGGVLGWQQAPASMSTSIHPSE